MRDENNFYSEFDDEENTWKDKVKEEVSRIENFVGKEIEKGTRTERNIQAYIREREKRRTGKSHEWMEELDHVTLGFLVIELSFLTYFILALIGIFPMF